MFSSGFAEGSSSDLTGGFDICDLPSQSQDGISRGADFAVYFDDSDFEDEESAVLDNDHDSLTPPPACSEQRDSMPRSDQDQNLVDDSHSQKRRTERENSTPGAEPEDLVACEDDGSQSRRNTRPKLSHPSSPRSREMELNQSDAHTSPPSTNTTSPAEMATTVEVPGPKKAHIPVRDVAYTTYRAVLYYVCYFSSTCHGEIKCRY